MRRSPGINILRRTIADIRRPSAVTHRPFLQPVVKVGLPRAADEIVVDLMALACGIDYNDAARDAASLTIDGVAIPIASPATLIRTKNTIRPSDAADRHYLEELLRAGRGRP